MTADPVRDRAAFAERIRTQLRSRYRGATVEVDREQFALRVSSEGFATLLPLAPLHQAVLREPAQTAALIGRFVNGVEGQITPRSVGGFSLDGLVWCVRTDSYLKGIARASELLQRELPADLVGFVAEELPGPALRGVPRGDWTAAGLDDDAVAAAADAHTERRFRRLVQRIGGAHRVPADGWRTAGDQLFESSALLVPGVLRAFAERAGGTVLLAVPDRSILLALPAGLPSAARFDRRVLREWREAMNPCSRAILETDGDGLRHHDRRGKGSRVMPWLGQSWVVDGGSAVEG